MRTMWKMVVLGAATACLLAAACGGTAGVPLGCHPACGPLEECAVDTCACIAPLTACSGSCVDLAADNGNCGACGAVCTGACERGYCVNTLGTTEEVPWALSQNTNHIFVVEHVLGKIVSIDKHSGGQVVVATAQVYPIAVASDDDGAYWLDQNGNLWRASTALPKPAKVTGLSTAKKVAIHAGTAYVLTESGIWLPTGTALAPLATGLAGTVDLATGPSAAVVATLSGLRALAYGTTAFVDIDQDLLSPTGVSATTTDAYVASEALAGAQGGVVGRVPLAGGTITVLAQALDAPGSFSVDGSDVLVTSKDPNDNYALLRIRPGHPLEIVPGLESVTRYGCVFDPDAIYCSKPTNGGTAAELVRVVRAPN